MTNNDILRRLRFTFNYNDKQVCDIFALADVGVTKEQVINWLRKDDDKDQVNLPDSKLSAFLNGWIVKNRGKRNGEQIQNEKLLTNNLILTKVKIALSFKADDIIALLKSVDFNLGKSELSAFFRKPDHKHYRQCKDQILRNLLTAIQKKQRPIQDQGERPNQVESSNLTTSEKATVRKKSTVNKAPKERSQGARPSKGKVYVNPKAAHKSDSSNGSNADKARKTLKLKPEQIWGSQANNQHSDNNEN